MAINNFIPQVWAGQILLNLHKAQIWGQEGVANRDYSGEIQNMGDTVRINAIGAVTVKTYAKNTKIALPDTLNDASSVMAIDQGDYWNFQVDDVDKVQQMPKVMNTALWEAAYATSDKADKYLATLALNGCDPTNIIGTDAAPKSDLALSAAQFSKAVDYLVDLSVLLDNANVPTSGRWAIVPPIFHGLLQRDLRFSGYNTPRAGEVLSNGIVGAAAGFSIMKSNNNPTTNSGGTYNVIAGYAGALSFAEQIVKVEAYRHPEYFADAVKGLHIYGGKVTRPQGLAILKFQDPGF